MIWSAYKRVPNVVCYVCVLTGAQSKVTSAECGLTKREDASPSLVRLHLLNPEVLLLSLPLSLGAGARHLLPELGGVVQQLLRSVSDTRQDNGHRQHEKDQNEREEKG